MGEVVTLRRPKSPTLVVVESEFEELHPYDTIGGIRLIIACRPNEKDHGPYHLVLRSVGSADYSVVNMSLGAGTYDEMMGAMSSFARAMLLTLRYADTHFDLLPNACGHSPETA